jgi:hypothetical protein
LWALSLLTATSVAVGCGGDDEATTSSGQGGSTSLATSSSTGTSSSSSGSGGGGGQITCEPTEGTTLALTKVNFGEGLSGEWKAVGLNVDGLVSTQGSTDVCQPNSDGGKDVAYPDGDDGIDNSFGKNILPMILGPYPEWPSDVNDWLEIGVFNALLKMYCLPPTGDAPELTTKVFGGTALSQPPQYDGTDEWPVAPELLGDPTDPESSTVVFEKSSVIGTTFDSGKNETFIFTIPMDYMGNFTSIKLTLYGARVIMTLSEDRKSVTGGMIGGVLDTEEFIAQVKKIGAMFDFCDQALFDTILTQVRQASDIMTDGSQDPTKTCDGISMGIAFEMKEVQIGEVGPAAPIGLACP